MTDRDERPVSSVRTHASTRSSRGTRALAAATLALVAVGVLGGCAQASDNAACRDERHQTRTDDTRCRDNQPDVDWVHFSPGRRIPALGEPIDPAETSPFPPSSSTPRGGLSPSGTTAGQETTSGSSGSGSSGRSSGGYVMTPDEPEEDDDDE